MQRVGICNKRLKGNTDILFERHNQAYLNVRVTFVFFFADDKKQIENLVQFSSTTNEVYPVFYTYNMFLIIIKNRNVN